MSRRYRLVEIRSPRSAVRTVAAKVDEILWGPQHEREMDWALGVLLVAAVGVFVFAVFPAIVKALHHG